MTDREDAWGAVHEALPAGWTVGPVVYDPGISAHSVAARTVAAGRNKPPVTVTGTGPDEAAAPRELDDRLRGVPQPDGSRTAERERRFRQSYRAGAEDQSRDTLGRGLTEEELEGVIRRMP
jgi:hypothetical protein